MLHRFLFGGGEGCVCGHGGATSHIAIIARSHGIPAVLGLGGRVAELRDRLKTMQSEKDE